MSEAGLEAHLQKGGILVTGGNGMLGRDLVPELERRGWTVFTPLHSDFDITQTSHLERMKKADGIVWVINCAAYTQVDQAEDDLMKCMAVNATGAGALAALCEDKNWRMVHISTDFVFDGDSQRPYTEDDPLHPLGAYGHSKMMGEKYVAQMHKSAIILRTSWLYGIHGKSFPRTMIEAWLAGKSLKVVNDQLGCPTSTVDLARVIADVVDSAPPAGIYHAAGPNSLTWHGFANLALRAYRGAVLKTDVPIDVAPCTTAEYPTRARRPLYSVLDTTKLSAAGIAPMRSTVESLLEFCQRLGAEKQPPL
jgi:dTDP-4-dehydrorhamnose reductase